MNAVETQRLTLARSRLWSAAMPRKDADLEKPQGGPGSARKKPGGPGTKDVGGDREARLAEALRANLRRRKSGAGEIDKKED
ncbi:MAG: hypothetical protein AAFX54_02000 [Pseudomonadota bacterium]